MKSKVGSKLRKETPVPLDRQGKVDALLTAIQEDMPPMFDMIAAMVDDLFGEADGRKLRDYVNAARSSQAQALRQAFMTSEEPSEPARNGAYLRMIEAMDPEIAVLGFVADLASSRDLTPKVDGGMGYTNWAVTIPEWMPKNVSAIRGIIGRRLGAGQQPQEWEFLWNCVRFAYLHMDIFINTPFTIGRAASHLSRFRSLRPLEGSAKAPVKPRAKPKSKPAPKAKHPAKPQAAKPAAKPKATKSKAKAKGKG